MAAQTAHESFTVKEVGHQTPVGLAANRIGRTGDPSRRPHLIHQIQGGHLVRHGDQRSADIRQLEEGGQEGGIVR